MQSEPFADFYETRDLFFAAFLDVKLGCVGRRWAKEYSHKRKREESVAYFQFKPSSSIAELKSQYFSGRGEVSALAFKDSLNNLRNLLQDRCSS